ncbi:RNA polymerase sigma factor [Thalassovita sp.]|jgi:RNA polymerase sigma-70 factor (ECF subfamily)|uniref:RNA polymerase sigma factor n=1 Tax=Thalassovita sp. TaxID=1979401 RepID=UPI002AAF2EC8|nr:RNA polymerase sigma factor [Thalassovita sp.]
MASLTQIEILLPELRAYARSIAETPDQADDLVQDAIERSLRAENPPSQLDALRPWMFRVLRNLNFDELRKKRVRLEYSRSHTRLLVDLAQSSDPANDILVRLTFDQLAAPQREVLFLVDVMGMKYAEAAEVMNVPTGTVMSRISRARRALIEAMRADQAPQGADEGQNNRRKDKGV